MLVGVTLMIMVTSAALVTGVRIDGGKGADNITVASPFSKSSFKGGADADTLSVTVEGDRNTIDGDRPV